jgi:hypothetical protein
MHCLKASKASLSNVCFLSPRPANLILLIIFFYARNINFSSFDLLRIGLTKIYFTSRWIATMMYLLPHQEVIGNAPVWLVWIESEKSLMRKKALWVLVIGMW